METETEMKTIQGDFVYDIVGITQSIFEVLKDAKDGNKTLAEQLGEQMDRFSNILSDLCEAVNLMQLEVIRLPTFELKILQYNCLSRRIKIISRAVCKFL
jgi:hypothetical protein